MSLAPRGEYTRICSFYLKILVIKFYLKILVKLIELSWPMLGSGTATLPPRLLNLVLHFHVFFLFDGDRTLDKDNNYIDDGQDRHSRLHPSLCTLKLVCVGWHAQVHRIRHSLRTLFERTVLKRRKKIVWDCITRRLVARRDNPMAAAFDETLLDIYSKAKRTDVVLDEGMMIQAHQGICT